MNAVANPIAETESVKTGFLIIPTNKPTSPVIKITISASILFYKVKAAHHQFVDVHDTWFNKVHNAFRRNPD